MTACIFFGMLRFPCVFISTNVKFNLRTKRTFVKAVAKFIQSTKYSKWTLSRVWNVNFICTKTFLILTFISAFKDYLSEKCPAEQYHSICRIVTEGFQDVSMEIQNIERDISNKVIARMIRDLQETERKKLQEVFNSMSYICWQLQLIPLLLDCANTNIDNPSKRNR